MLDVGVETLKDIKQTVKYPYGGIGIRSGFRHHTIEGSSPSMGTNKKVKLWFIKNCIQQKKWN